MPEQKNETWKNGVKGTIGVLKFDRRGELTQVMIRSGQSVTLSTNERKINQERAALPKYDNFSNGAMVPVLLFDDVDDAAEIASNPNLMGEEDMKDLFSAHWKVFDEKIASIGNRGTLLRLIQVGQGEEGATARQMKALEDRLEAVTPQMLGPRDDRIGADAGTPGKFKPITPI